jgi:hypothetical protein
MCACGAGRPEQLVSLSCPLPFPITSSQGPEQYLKLATMASCHIICISSIHNRPISALFISKNDVKWTNDPSFRFSAVGKMRKETISYVMCVCLSGTLSVHMEHLGSHWTDFQETWYWNIFQKSVEKIQGSSKFYNNNRYFTCRPIYIYDHI